MNSLCSLLKFVVSLMSSHTTSFRTSGEKISGGGHDTSISNLSSSFEQPADSCGRHLIFLGAVTGEQEVSVKLILGAHVHTHKYFDSRTIHPPQICRWATASPSWRIEKD
jgi:hypothetical protein